MNSSFLRESNESPSSRSAALSPAAEPAKTPIVEVDNVFKAFGPQHVLNGVSLNVSPGETMAVLGRSGSGKSVLLRLIVGLQEPDSGSVRVFGQDIAGIDRKSTRLNSS